MATREPDCIKAVEIARLEENQKNLINWQAKQNGSLQKIEFSVSTLATKLDIALRNQDDRSAVVVATLEGHFNLAMATQSEKYTDTLHEVDIKFDNIIEEVKATVSSKTGELGKQLDGVRNVFIGILVSVMLLCIGTVIIIAREQLFK
jgi:hypothetical protein